MSAFTDYVKNFIGARLSSSITGSFAFSQTELDFIESEALELYGVDTAAEATDDYKIHTLLKYKALERMWIEVSDAIDHKTDGESWSNSQFASMIEKMFKQAKKDASPYIASGQISLSNLDTGYDPYLRSR